MLCMVARSEVAAMCTVCADRTGFKIACSSIVLWHCRSIKQNTQSLLQRCPWLYAHVPVILARQVRTHADVAATCASAVLLHLFIALSATLRKGRDYTSSSLAVHMLQLQTTLILAQFSQDTSVRQVKTRAAAMGLGCRYVQSQFHYNPKQPCNALILLRRLLLSAAWKVQYASTRISLSKNKSASHGAVVCADYPSILVGAW